MASWSRETYLGVDGGKEGQTRFAVDGVGELFLEGTSGSGQDGDRVYEPCCRSQSCKYISLVQRHARASNLPVEVALVIGKDFARLWHNPDLRHGEGESERTARWRGDRLHTSELLSILDGGGSGVTGFRLYSTCRVRISQVDAPEVGAGLTMVAGQGRAAGWTVGRDVVCDGRGLWDGSKWSACQLFLIGVEAHVMGPEQCYLVEGTEAGEGCWSGE